ncbi:uncharacterized protein EI90DRAFT_1353804 [Cantharellus anzutake]|uniref:uncharacterized protein n=1 Tax=Cantharellus anzutake TaxID=1750568 RepID=UPI001907D8D6|nr:uncharacterized protein EI90DRAFT_1353804 [Cantharellus anzutake]KAF8329849.1 hypothetical protein EI90DRAFT_1353804 [Cantharellus anzutake]
MTIVAPHLSPSWWTSLSVTILILNFLAPSEAQNTNVTCGPDWDWAQNSKGQNPCLVAAYLMEMCYYPTSPTGDASTQNECVCSTPVYQLMSACGACQGRLFVGWQEWKFYCPSYGFGAGQFPKAVPVGTAVQYWAQIDPAIWGDNFNADRAKAIGGIVLWFTPEIA